MDLWSVKQAASYWGVSLSRARAILAQRRIRRVSGYPADDIKAVTFRQGERNDIRVNDDKLNATIGKALIHRIEGDTLGRKEMVALSAAVGRIIGVADKTLYPPSPRAIDHLPDESRLIRFVGDLASGKTQAALREVRRELDRNVSVLVVRREPISIEEYDIQDQNFHISTELDSAIIANHDVRLIVVEAQGLSDVSISKVSQTVSAIMDDKPEIRVIIVGGHRPPSNFTLNINHRWFDTHVIFPGTVPHRSTSYLNDIISDLIIDPFFAECLVESFRGRRTRIMSQAEEDVRGWFEPGSAEYTYVSKNLGIYEIPPWGGVDLPVNDRGQLSHGFIYTRSNMYKFTLPDLAR